MRGSARLFRARFVVPTAERVLVGGGIVVGPGGTIERVLESPADCARHGAGLECIDLGEATLTAGLVCAHAHLELTALAGRVPAGDTFVDWIRALLSARGACSRAELADGLERGARALLASGVTLVGDIDSLALPRAACGPRVVRYREVLDAGDEARCAAALEALGALAEGDGISPHAPYTTSTTLLAALARLRGERPLAVHWAETDAEHEWLEGARGPFATLLAHSPRRSGLDLLADAGLLSPGTALVHAHRPRPGEIERVARTGACVVHCPGTTRFFARAPFPWSAWRAGGVEIALGTDSAASNDALSMTSELALLRAAQPALAPAEVWHAATSAGARALGEEQRCGTLAVGRRADLAAWRTSAARADGVLDELTHGAAACRGVWLAGAHVFDECAGTAGALPWPGS